MPESVTDRCTKSHEHIFLLAKSEKYFFDQEAIKELAAYDGRKDLMMHGSQKYKGATHGQSKNSMAANGHVRWKTDKDGNFVRNKRSVWSVSNNGFREAHFATFPEKLIEPCVLAGCPVGGYVLDPFSGAGTSGLVALKNGRKYIGIELNPEYLDMSIRRIEREAGQQPLFAVGVAHILQEAA